MRSVMIEAIRTNDAEFMDIFGSGFDRGDKWATYLEQNFGPKEPLTVDRILDRGDRWHSARFQALYVACWIYHPVEKGSYMIKLSPQQKANALASAKQLSSRASSHLKGDSYSAGKNFAFINGYAELLVMVYEDFLFLKMEGHAAASIAHLQAWYVKWKTGEGNMNNPKLHDIATQKSDFGVLARGAENYSKGYEKFLKELGLKGKTVTLGDTLKALKAKTSLALEATPTYEHVKIFLKAVPAKLSGALLTAFNDATEDLMGIARDALKMDSNRLAHDGVDGSGMDRIFREIRLDPQRIDRKLNKFYKGVNARSFEEVKSYNNA